MVLLTRVFTSPERLATRSWKDGDAAELVRDLAASGAVKFPVGDYFAALNDAFAFASKEGVAERITLESDGETLRVLVKHRRGDGFTRSISRVPAALPGTVADRILAGVLAAYRVPYEVLHVDYLPDAETLVLALRLAPAPAHDAPPVGAP